MSVFQPVRDSASALDQRVVIYIRDLVESGQLVAGERLPAERDLATQLGVSRTALREALHTLAALGLVELRHGRGVFITGGSTAATAQRLSASLGVADHVARLHELFEIRRVLEGSAAGWAAERATPAQIAEMRAVLDEARQACNLTPLDYAVVGQLDARFHALVAGSAANRTLTLLMATLLTELGVARGHSLKIPGRVARSIAQHDAIVAAIVAQDAALARGRMLEHLDDVESDILRVEKSSAE